MCVRDSIFLMRQSRWSHEEHSERRERGGEPAVPTFIGEQLEAVAGKPKETNTRVQEVENMLCIKKRVSFVTLSFCAFNNFR